MVVLNKADVCPDLRAAVARTSGAAPGVPVLVVAPSPAWAWTTWRATSAVIARSPCSASGVGKSTLINRMVSRDLQRVQEVRDDGKGRHTTTHRELIVRPGGGLVLDTPGLHKLQLWDAPRGSPRPSPRSRTWAASCRFADCAHESEPGCTVLAAVAAGRLPLDRLDGYRKLLGEVRHFEARHDARAPRERSAGEGHEPGAHVLPGRVSLSELSAQRAGEGHEPGIRCSAGSGGGDRRLGGRPESETFLRLTDKQRTADQCAGVRLLSSRGDKTAIESHGPRRFAG